MKRPRIIMVLVVIAAATTLVVRLAHKPTGSLRSNSTTQWNKPAIDVRFLGMTNDAAGTKLARFELSNIGSVSTAVSIPGFIDLGMRVSVKRDAGRRKPWISGGAARSEAHRPDNRAPPDSMR